MAKRVVVVPPKPMAIQTRLALSMVYQVKHKLKLANWMQPRDVVEANPMIFERIQNAIRHDYDFPFTIDHSWRAVELLLKGIKDDQDPPS